MARTNPSLKTPTEVAGIRAGGEILGNILAALAELARPGISTAELNDFAEKEIKRAGAESSFKGYGPKKNPFPAALCTSINDVVVHGLPSRDEILEAGDIISLDLGIRYRKLYSDGAITVPVGPVTSEAQRLIATARRALDQAISVAVPGGKMGE